MPRLIPTNTPIRGSIHGRGRIAMVLFLCVALGFVGTSAAFAATDPLTPHDAQESAARVVEFPMSSLWTNHFWAYGGDPRDGETIPVPMGRDTRTLVLDVDIEPLGSVVCNMGDGESAKPAATATWTAEQWSSDASKAFAVPEVTGPYTLSCKSGAADQPHWQIRWSIYFQNKDVGPVAVLTDGEKYLTVSGATHQYSTPGPAIPVTEGDVVRISGTPGIWPQDDHLRVTLFTDAVDLPRVIVVPDVVISADGSTAEFVMPAEPFPGFFGLKATFELRATTSSTEGPPRHSESTSFGEPLVFDSEPVTTPIVDVSLSARYALSFQRLNAIATVRTGTVPSTGTVAFKVNGKPVGTVPVTNESTASLRLPALAKGRYSITATFTPASGSPAAVSPGVWLRVLR